VLFEDDGSSFCVFLVDIGGRSASHSDRKSVVMYLWQWACSIAVPGIFVSQFAAGVLAHTRMRRSTPALPRASSI
jgi:hypothetical protein